MSVRKILLFILSVLVMLALIGFFFPKEGIRLGQFKLHFRSLPELVTKQEQTAPDPEQQLALMAEAFINKELAVLADSLEFYKSFFRENPVRIHFPDNNPDLLDAFFESLDSSIAQNKVIRVMHYGDSQIEQDRISSTLRDGLQHYGGGMSIGMIPAVQVIPSRSVKQHYEGNISRQLLYGPAKLRAPHNRYGPMAMVCQVEDYAYLSVKMLRRRDSDISNNFSRIRLLLGNNSPDFKATLELENIYDTKIVEAVSDFSILSWELKKPAGSFNLFLSGSAEIYGILLDGHAGVAVDNIPLRGSSGTLFTGINSSLLQKVYREMDVQLFLLEFGGNRMPSIRSQDDIDKYVKAIGRQIRYLKALAPGAQVLFIGPADMSCSLDGSMQTYPLLEELIEGLKEVVLNNDAAFWDLYHVMGGHNAMLKWVNTQPALAAPDYIHFTLKGAKRIATLLSNSVELCYKYYQFRKRHQLNDSTLVNISNLNLESAKFTEQFEQFLRDSMSFGDTMPDLDTEAVLEDFLELWRSNMHQKKTTNLP